jgi:excisionase family DNA binding protein
MSDPTSLDQILPDYVYTLSELAPLLKVSVVTLNREVHARKLVAAKVRGQWRVQGKDFIAYLDICKEEEQHPRQKGGANPPSGQGRPFKHLRVNLGN